MFCSFFFSSRRRHTRSKRDWSSDVCSSDLLEYADVIHENPSNRLLVYRHDRLRLHHESHHPRPSLHRHKRSEERRVGKECRSGWGPCHEKRKVETVRTECWRSQKGQEGEV